MITCMHLSNNQQCTCSNYLKTKRHSKKMKLKEKRHARDNESKIKKKENLLFPLNKHKWTRILSRFNHKNIFWWQFWHIRKTFNWNEKQWINIMVTTKKKKEIYIIEKRENLLRILSRRLFPFVKQALIYVFVSLMSAVGILIFPECMLEMICAVLYKEKIRISDINNKHISLSAFFFWFS